MEEKEAECYQKHTNMDFDQQLCFLSPPRAFPIHFQIRINPTQEHKKMGYVSRLWSDPIQKGFWFGCGRSTNLHMCKRKAVYEGETA